KDGNKKAIETVTVEGGKATVKVAGGLTEGEYTVVVSNVVSTEGSELASASTTFTYKKRVAASVAFNKTNVVVGEQINLVVKDANGNDISADYSRNDFQVSTTNSNIVDGTLKATSSAVAAPYNVSVVTATLANDNKVTTGNVLITVT